MSISCATEGATIYYTTNGDEPTTNSTVYTAAINVSTNTTIKAIAAKSGYDNSTVASAVYNIVTIEHDGTQADPYTVADARAAIDANVGTQGVYVSGIVTRRYNNTVSNGKLSYYISDDGTQTNELEAYKGLYLNGDEFTSYEQIQAGDVVVIYGDLTKFNSTYELAEGNYLVSHTQGTTPSISADNVTLAYDATSGEIEYTITNPASGVTLTASTTASWISDLTVDATNSKVTFTTTANEGTEDRTATVTLSYTGATDKTVTVTQKHYVADYATLPFEFDGNATAVDNTDGLTQNGLDSYNSSPKLQFNTTGDWLILHFNERPGTLSFNIKGNGFSGGTFTVQTSEDGTNYSDLTTYTELSGTAQTEEFNNLGENVRYIKWIYTNKSSGNVALGAITLAQYVAPTGPTVNMGTLTHVSINEIWDSTLDNISLGDEVEEGSYVYFSLIVDDGYTLDEVSVLDASNNEVELDENQGSWSFYMPDSDVTINATASIPPVIGDRFELYTGELVEGDYLIVYNGAAMNNDVSTNNRLQYETVTATNDVIATDNAAIVWHIAPSGGYWTIYSEVVNLFAASTGTKNEAQMLEDGTDDKALWLVSAVDGNYEFVNKKNSDASVNANLRRNGTYGFACYSTSTGGALSLYKKVPTLDITGYGTSTGGYVLIATPTANNADPEEIGMLTDNYDLYYYNEMEDLEWRNYKDPDEGVFDLEPGKGYLYASKTDVTLVFRGAENSGFVNLLLPYTENDFVKSIYLAGNSSTEAQTFYVYNQYGSKEPFNYITLNEAGNAFVSTQTASYEAPAMTGFFVQAPGANMTLSIEDNDSKANVSLLNINVLRDRGSVIDNAIVSFSNGSMMEKFYLMNNTTRVYIPQGNREMAIANSAAEAEMPVSFRASENGTYTLAIETENVEMNYLHLIDNMTGMDVDLLQTPSYTFEAKTSDYTSRFRLVFKANGTNENNAETFAYFNGTNWTVSNVGDATLQVVDVTGRTVANQMINGNAELNLNQPAGVYVIRLVNGDNVKTQKVVVR